MYGVAASTLAALAVCVARAALRCAVTSVIVSARANATSSEVARRGRLAAMKRMGGGAVSSAAQCHQLVGELAFDHADDRSAHGQAGCEVAPACEQAPSARGERGGDGGVGAASEPQPHARERDGAT